MQIFQYVLETVRDTSEDQNINEIKQNKTQTLLLHSHYSLDCRNLL